MEIVVLASAQKHGISIEDTAHAVRNFIAAHDTDTDLTMLVGPDTTGRLLEVGVVESAEGALVAVHSMETRPKYLP